jgi:hypothetical protein
MPIHIFPSAILGLAVLMWGSVLRPAGAYELWEPVDSRLGELEAAHPIDLDTVAEVELVRQPGEIGLVPEDFGTMPLPPTNVSTAPVAVPLGGYYGGAEVIFFKPFGEAGQTVQEVIAETGADSFLPAWRLWGGYTDAEGLGWRVRWWQYDQFSNAEDQGVDLFSRLIFQKLDVEATQLIRYRTWDLLFSGGVTWIGNEVDLGQVGAADFDRWRMDAAGVTAGLQAVRRSRRWEYWRWQGWLQASGVFGNSLSQTQVDPIGYQPSTVGGILEIAVGPRWERPISGGALLFAGGNAEAQYWMTGLGSILDGTTPDGQGSIGLLGLSFNVGIRR